MKLLKTSGEIMEGKFACNVKTVKMWEERVISPEWNIRRETFKVTELVLMTEEEFKDFKKDFLITYEWLAGKGGTYCTANGTFRMCIGITTPKAKEMIVVDPQGYSYARYVTVIKQ
jgi:hypothetical protein